MVTGVIGSFDEHPVEDFSAPRIDAILAEFAVSTPDRPAVVTGGSTLTYSELFRRSGEVSASLPAGRNPIAVTQDLSTESVVWTFAVLLSGRAVIPIDPGLPAGRVDTIVDMCDAVVASRATMAAEPGSSTTRAGYDPGAVAVVNFTSGSTGVPKGVVHTHHTVMTKAADMVTGLGLRADDRIANLLPLGFSAGFTTLLAGISCGAGVLCADTRDSDINAVLHWLRSEDVSIVHASVALARALGTVVRDGAAAPLTTVRQICVFGEPAVGRDVEAARHLSEPAPAVANWYGATEIGVVAHTVVGPTDPLPAGRIPAGRSFDKHSVSILDEQGVAVSDGSVGEVHFGGGPRSPGYVHEMTDPFGRSHPLDPTVYRTGDRGFLDDEGQLHITGRSAHAVKIRGYLVDPSEIEKTLHAVPGVDEVHVRAVESDGRTQLVAYVGGPIATTPDADRHLRSAMRTELPEWMVPQHVITLDLSRTERGKVDRHALPEPTTPRPARTDRASGDVIEKVVRYAVLTAMGHDDMAADDDLMALGADSLALTAITARIHQNLNIEVDLAAFTASPTIATLVDGIRHRSPSTDSGRDGVLVPLRGGGTGATLVLIAGAGAPASCFVRLVRRLGPGGPVLGVQQRGLERRGRPDRSVAAMARRCLTLIVEAQPHGPYVLSGHSMGGLVALELAALLEARGERVLHVIPIDTALQRVQLRDLGRDTAAEPDGASDAAATDAEPMPHIELTRAQLVMLLGKLLIAGRVMFDPVTQWAIFYYRGGYAARRHRLRAIDAPVTVLCAPEGHHVQEWWDAVSRRGATLQSISGGHVELLHEPYVAEVAAAMERLAGPTPEVRSVSS